jgi:hypothetical protein
MGLEETSSGWLLLLAQLPTSPSSPRVALWRRLRAAGAARVLNSAWMLPPTAAHAALFERLLETVRDQGGTGLVLTVSPSPHADEEIVGRFRADRAREYDEFDERCSVLLAEVGRESEAAKFTFAELEESEQDLVKLSRWQRKIQARDFFPDQRLAESTAMIDRCKRALQDFSRAVYEAEGVQGPGEAADLGTRPMPGRAVQGLPALQGSGVVTGVTGSLRRC